MKKLIVLLLGITLSMSVQAKSLREMWFSMPDSLIPTLNRNLRIELVDLVDMKVKSEVKGLLGEDCMMDTLTLDFAQLGISKVSSVQMKMLPWKNEGDSILCVVKTFSAPEKESDILFYDKEWRKLPSETFFADGQLVGMVHSLVCKPDTMSEEHYQEKLILLEPKMCYANLSEKENTIVFGLSLPLVSNEEKTLLEAILLQRKFKWNGEMFNEN